MHELAAGSAGRTGPPELPGEIADSLTRRKPRPAATGAEWLLLVDDDFMLRAFLAEILAKDGYRVVCAANGREALLSLNSAPLPSAILLDMMMPQLTGMAFRRMQLDSPVVQHIPVIAMTARPASGGLLDLGFAEILSKPVDIERLLKTLDGIFPVRH